MAADGALVRQGAAVHQLACGFATAIDGRVDKIIENLAIVKPTFMGAAPRIFEKAHARIVTMQAAEGGLKEKIFAPAFEVGLKVDALEREGKSVPLPLSVQHALFDRLVFTKIRERSGPGAVLHLRRGSAEPRHRRVVPRRGHLDPGGLRLDRDLGRLVRQPPRSLQVRHGRPGRSRAAACASARATRSRSPARA